MIICKTRCEAGQPHQRGLSVVRGRQQGKGKKGKREANGGVIGHVGGLRLAHPTNTGYQVCWGM